VKQRLLLLDGHSLAYRAFFALPVENFTTAQGQHTNAIYGFASMLINLIRDEKPTHIAVAFDVSRKTFRSEKFPEYKANRASTPDEFRSQISFINELVDGFRIPRYEKEGFEADDIIATISTEAVKEGFEVLICTGDRDSFQLVSHDVTVLYPKKGVTELARMTPEAVAEKYGLKPSQYPDFAALRGDPSDNLPSIPGVGEKTATKWIQEYGSLKELIARIDEVGGKVGDSLRSHISSVITNRELTQLIHDVPLPFTLDKWSGIDSQRIFTLFDQLEIKSLKERLKAISSDSNSFATTASNSKTAQVHIIEKSSKEVAKLITGPFAISLALIDSEISEYSISLDGATNYHVKDGDLTWLANSQYEVITHDARPLLHRFPSIRIAMDTHLAGYLINPGSRSLRLEDLSEKYLGITPELKEETLFNTSLFDARSAGYIWQLKNVIDKELVDRNLHSLLVDLEIPVLKALCKMEMLGIAVDTKKLQDLEKFFRNEVERESATAYEAAGREFNVASPKQLQAVLFDELKLPKTKKIKTGYTTDAESLEWLFSKTGHPVLKSLLRIREAGKLRTVIEGLLSAIGRDGRIHTTFQQTVAATGRLSSTDPNLQNIPVRTEEGRKIRDAFVAEPPFTTLLTADYSQIEMRIMAHLSGDKKLITAFRSGEDLHSTVASEVFSVEPTAVTPDMRRQIKAMSYGLAYGLSSFGLAQQLDLSPSEASELMSKYFERFGGIQTYLKSVVEEARSKGYTETILGRRRYLPDLNADNKQRRDIAERMALNAPIQGSAADIIKVAMLNVLNLIRENSMKSRLLLQVHDELIFEIAPNEDEAMEKLVREAMGSAYELNVPLEVNVGFGKSWDLAAH
jgi:DNA polymerase-1